MERETIAGRMKAAGNTRGFDYLRLILAAGVIAWHTIVVAYGTATAYGVWHGPFRALPASILPMFFALSGFLVAGSMERCKTIEGFATLRVLRIAPALAVEVLLSALILGPILTTVSLGAYFSHGQFWRYLLNMVGYIHYELPGVFLENPRPVQVNLSLWTVPYELECYLALIALTVLGFFQKRRLFLAATIVAAILLPVAYLIKNDGAGMQAHLPGKLLVVSFLAGISIYLYRDKIPNSRLWALAAAALTILTLTDDRLSYFAVFPAAYLTVWLGLLNPPKIPVLMDGDYSYGMYLFAFPIQQMVAMFEPLRSFTAVFFIALPLSLLYAAFSWHMIEKPVLAQKKAAVGFVERVGGRARSLAKMLSPGNTKPEPL